MYSLANRPHRPDKNKKDRQNILPRDMQHGGGRSGPELRPPDSYTELHSSTVSGLHSCFLYSTALVIIITAISYLIEGGHNLRGTDDPQAYFVDEKTETPGGDVPVFKTFDLIQRQSPLDPCFLAPHTRMQVGLRELT